MSVFDALSGALVASVQAPPGSPLRSPGHMAAIARATELGGAGAIRANGAEDIAAIREAIALPVIGLYKDGPPERVRITPRIEQALAVASAGAAAVAVDATLRPRDDGSEVGHYLALLCSELPVPVLADVDDLASGVAAREAGAHAVATTLSGYTEATAGPSGGPDVELVARLAEALDCPVVAEGRYASPDQVRAAFAAGAAAVVVGTAITDPTALTAGLVAATPAAEGRA